MRSKIVLLLFLTALIGIPASGAILFTEDFESAPNPNNSATVLLDQWYCSGEGGASSVTSLKHNSAQLLSTLSEGTDGSGDPNGFALRTGYAYDDASTRRVISTETWDETKSYTLAFRLAATDHTAKVPNIFTAILRAYDSGSGVFTLIKQQTFEPTIGKWKDAVVTVTSSELAAAGVDGQMVSIWFWHEANTDFHHIDDIVLVDDIVSAAVKPLNGVKDIPVNTDFEWTFDDAAAGFTPTKYVLTYGPTDPNWAAAGTTVVVDDATSPYNPPADLEMDTLYYWRVDAYEGTTQHTGLLWRFTTVPPLPVIVQQPDHALVYPGEDAVFIVVAENPYTNDDSDLSYQWYKYVDGTNDTALGTDSAALTIAEAQEANEGQYYCVVTITSNNQNLATNNAMLGVKVLEAHWTLNAADYSDGQYQDISGHANHATTNGNPVFAEGADGLTESAAIIYDNGSASNGTWNPAEYTNKMTISLWIKWDGTPGGNPLVCKRDGWGNTTAMWTLNLTDAGRVRFGATQGGSDWTSGVSVDVDQWTHIEVVWDGVSPWVYKNGLFVSAAGFWIPDLKTDAPIYIGVYDLVNTAVFNGQLDDIRIYNYARTDEEIVEDFYAISGQTVCLNPPQLDFTGPDGVPDCYVDLYDLQAFIAEWMTCNMVPTCLP